MDEHGALLLPAAHPLSHYRVGYLAQFRIELVEGGQSRLAPGVSQNPLDENLSAEAHNAENAVRYIAQVEQMHPGGRERRVQRQVS